MEEGVYLGDEEGEPLDEGGLYYAHSDDHEELNEKEYYECEELLVGEEKSNELVESLLNLYNATLSNRKRNRCM